MCGYHAASMALRNRATILTQHIRPKHSHAIFPRTLRRDRTTTLRMIGKRSLTPVRKLANRANSLRSQRLPQRLHLRPGIPP